MKLKVYERNDLKKSFLTKLRIENKIACIVYAQGIENKNIYIEKDKFLECIRYLNKGSLSITVFELDGLKEKNSKVIIKEIQYDKTSYEIIHIDFMLLQDNIEVNVKIPIECVNAAECVGIKMGGILRQLMRKVQIRCLPKNIPTKFIVDVSQMKMLEKKKVQDLKIPDNVFLITNLNEAAIVIAKR